MTHSQREGSGSLVAAVRLKRLASFAPRFRDPELVFGYRRPDGGTGTRDDPTILGSFELTEIGTQFYRMLYDEGWIVQGFDWSEWIRTQEGQLLATNRETLGMATSDQLAKLL